MPECSDAGAAGFLRFRPRLKNTSNCTGSGLDSNRQLRAKNLNRIRLLSYSQRLETGTHARSMLYG